MIRGLKMANKEQLKRLRQGVQKWNIWRVRNPEQIDLIGADLTGANLSEANLSGANLIEVNLGGAYLGTTLSFSTVFAKNDLTSVKGLDTIRHLGPSQIDFRTVIFPAPGPILTTFLRDTGSSGYLIEAVNGRSLPLQPVSVKVFISFAPSDQSLCQNLRDHLSLLVRLKMITLSHEEVQASDIHLWEEKVNAAFATFAAFWEAQVILLLVSASFLASHQVWKEVIEPALRRHQQGDIRLIPILLRPTDWKGSPLADLQVLPTDGKPVTEWEQIDTPLTEVSERLRKVVQPLHEVLMQQARKRRERDLVTAKLILTTMQAAEKQGTIQKQKQAVEEAEKTYQALQAQLREVQQQRQDLFQVQETLQADLAILERTSMTLNEEIRTLDTQLQSSEEIFKEMINGAGG
jgi:uncharacterized protein YjbI with pentapeptide repeats